MQQPYNFRSHPQSPYPSSSNIVNPDASSNINPIIDSKINTTINSNFNPTMNSNINTNNSTNIQVIVSSTEVDCACPYCNSSLPRYRPGLISFLTGISLCCCYYQMFWLPCIQNQFLDEKNMYRNRRRKQREIK
ncbi:3113_t:CDS:1, partial [Gigaspora rosea]